MKEIEARRTKATISVMMRNFEMDVEEEVRGEEKSGGGQGWGDGTVNIVFFLGSFLHDEDFILVMCIYRGLFEY